MNTDRPPPASTVAIAGAGICGLATAVALARIGTKVRVFEKRSDPDTPEGRKSQKQIATLLNHANAALEAGEDGRPHFDNVQALRSRLWGTRYRNIILDSHVLHFMMSIGVDVSEFAALERMQLFWGDSAPEFSIEYGDRPPLHPHDDLQASHLVHCRDWAALPSIQQVERALRSCAEQHANIEFEFDSEIVSAEPDGTDLAITYQRGEEKSIRSDLLIVADGGDHANLVPQASDNAVKAEAEPDQETLNVSVFETDPTALQNGTASHHTHGFGGIFDFGWGGMACNPQFTTVNLADMSRRLSPQSSFDFARQNGVTGPVIEFAAHNQYTIKRAPCLHHRERIILAGDAAMRGSPLFGLGAQYGILWARLIRDHLRDATPTAPRPHQIAPLLRDATEALERRSEFESACWQVLRSIVEGQETFSGFAFSTNLFDNVRDMTMNYRQHEAGMLASVAMNIDFTQPHRSRARPETNALKGLEHVAIRSELLIKFEDKKLRIELSSSNAIKITTGHEQITLDSGALDVFNNGRDWVVELHDTVLKRTFLPENTGASASLTPVRNVAMNMPNQFINAGLRQIRHALCNRQIPSLSFEMAFATDSIVSAGPLELKLTDTPRFRITTETQPDKPQISVKLINGHAEPTDFATFLKELPLLMGRGVNFISTLSAGLSDAPLNMWSRLVGRRIKGVDLHVYPDGSGLLIYNMRIPVPLYLGAGDMQALLDTIFTSHVAAQFLARMPNVIQSMNVTHRGTASAPNACENRSPATYSPSASKHRHDVAAQRDQ